MDAVYRSSMRSDTSVPAANCAEGLSCVPSIPNRYHDASAPVPISNKLGARTVEQFLNLESDILQGPPPFSWQYIREFLASANLKVQTRSGAATQKSGQCLFDSLALKVVHEGHASVCTDVQPTFGRNWIVKVHPSQPHERRIVTAEQLTRCLEHSEVKNTEQRTIIFMTDMTPDYAAALATRVDIRYAGLLREYLQSHLADESEFTAVVSSNHGSDPSHKWPRHSFPSVEFVFAFHIPYVALRDDRPGPDPRGVRESVPLVKELTINDKYPTNSDLVCYEAQVSFVVLGISQTDWYAICNVDTWFGSEQDIGTYLSQDDDGPSGAVRSSKGEYVHPREYFLLVLSQRVRQISSEWGGVFTHLTKRLDTYETHYLQTIDSESGDLHDDEGMSRTRLYSKAASMLRQYHDTLAVTLGRLDTFLKENDQLLFGNMEDFNDQCGCYRTHIDRQRDHLNRWRKRLFSRMQRFDVMRDGLLSASALRENRRAYKQSYDIRILTNVTIIYLPFSAAATIFGMSSNTPDLKVWIYWIIVSIALCLVTSLVAFGSRSMALLPKHWSSVKSMRSLSNSFSSQQLRTSG